MEIGWISKEELSAFETLILPEIVDMIKDGQPVTALGLAEAQMAVGALAGALENGRFHVLSFYVAPDYRRRGGGKLLLDTLFPLLEDFAEGIEVEFTITQPEHKALEAFLLSQGFQSEEYGTGIYATTLGQICEQPFFKNKTIAGGTAFRDLNPAVLVMLERSARIADITVPEGGLQSIEVDADVSTTLFNGIRPQGFALVLNKGSLLVLEGVWNGDAEPSAVPVLLRGALIRASQKYSPETSVVIQTVDDVTESLVWSLLPDCETISRTMYRSLT